LPKFRQLVRPSDIYRGEVRRTLIDRLGGAALGITGHAAPVAVDRGRDGRAVAGGRIEHQHGCVGLGRAADGARLHDRVVLLEHRRP
jgi:hypothetical protein